MHRRTWVAGGAALAVSACIGPVAAGQVVGEQIRVATFNLQDLRADEIFDATAERPRRLARIIQELRPDIILLNEIAYDYTRVDARYEYPEGQNGQRFADTFLAVSQAEGLEPIRYTAIMGPVNTGLHSGHDLDNDGRNDRNLKGGAYARDCLGYGEFPGQYGMALLIREGAGEMGTPRTFRQLAWASAPFADMPPGPDGVGEWFDDNEKASLPLSSKSHWDIPITLNSGAVVHMLCSHPTPPVFDGEEDRNGRRNHDEIRFWASYLDDEQWIRDDLGKATGGLPPEASFVILGDLNADPEAGDSRGNPIGTWLLDHPRINGDITPASRIAIPRLDPTDTVDFRLRVDYVLPSTDLAVTGSGVWRGPADTPGKTGASAEPADMPTDHFPVWVDLVVPDPPAGPKAE